MEREALAAFYTVRRQFQIGLVTSSPTIRVVRIKLRSKPAAKRHGYTSRKCAASTSGVIVTCFSLPTMVHLLATFNQFVVVRLVLD